jgi:hypothetical protein
VAAAFDGSLGIGVDGAPCGGDCCASAPLAAKPINPKTA